MSFAYRISAWNRARKWRRFSQLFSPAPDTTILDVGFSNQEYSDSDNFLEKHYPYPERITALGVEEPLLFQQRYPAVKAVTYDGTVFPFPDRAFHIGWSNAVLEHVGDRERQVLFLKEIARTCGHAFVTTPNRLFPIEVHTRVPLLHWLPKAWFDRFLTLIGKQWATGSYMRLLSHHDIINVLHDAGITDYRIYRNYLGPFTLDFVIIIGDTHPTL